ncbi:MFS transporter permease [Desulfosarcina sp. OttesenSCG-928-B08]|nr:MFS transporter permease [Desulfosarcina sp. OttesenSCG-928-B08]
MTDDNNNAHAAAESLTDVVIPRENAVFWMDEEGRWCNGHGRFRHKRIIDHFNQSLCRDANGYFVTQIRGQIREKVYFFHADTPLFVVRIVPGTPIRLALNTTRMLDLSPDQLFSRNDQLYQRMGDECVRFSDRALVSISEYLEETPSGLGIRIGGTLTRIPEENQDTGFRK